MHAKLCAVRYGKPFLPSNHYGSSSSISTCNAFSLSIYLSGASAIDGCISSRSQSSRSRADSYGSESRYQPRFRTRTFIKISLHTRVYQFGKCFIHYHRSRNSHSCFNLKEFDIKSSTFFLLIFPGITFPFCFSIKIFFHSIKSRVYHVLRHTKRQTQVSLTCRTKVDARRCRHVSFVQ